ncbi:hypothetical protein JL722_14518 [Aureococcus anophagefferens]|nr:hypothetical protein JL722_14518 [Aureococcus anophagefferens]
MSSSGEADNFRRSLVQMVWAVASATAFGLILWYARGRDSAIAFFSGYLVEQSLSVDNLFVFIMLFEYFRDSGGRRCSSGILLLSPVKLLMEGDEDEDVGDNLVMRLSRKLVGATTEYDGDRFFTVVDGAKRATPLLLCLVCVELSDVVFAVDSIPAVLGISTDPFVVYSSNVFAIAGLRSTPPPRCWRRSGKHKTEDHAPNYDAGDFAPASPLRQREGFAYSAQDDLSRVLV